MKTIKILPIIFASMLGLTSCESESAPEPQPPTPTTQGKFFSMRCDMPAEASEKTVSLTGLTTAITRQVQALETSWLSVTQLPYTSGTPRVNVSCTQNKETTRRVMDIVFLANNDKDTLLLTVTQDGYSGSAGDNGIDVPTDTPTDQPAYGRQTE